MSGDSENEVNLSVHNSDHSIENEIKIKSVASSADLAGAQPPKVDRDRNKGQCDSTILRATPTIVHVPIF